MLRLLWVSARDCASENFILMACCCGARRKDTQIIHLQGYGGRPYHTVTAGEDVFDTEVPHMLYSMVMQCLLHWRCRCRCRCVAALFQHAASCCAGSGAGASAGRRQRPGGVFLLLCISMAVSCTEGQYSVYLCSLCTQITRGVAVLGYAPVGDRGLVLLATRVKPVVTLPGGHEVKLVTGSKWASVPLKVSA